MSDAPSAPSAPPITVLVSAGGTGGGVYPALTVVDALKRRAPGCRVHFVGSAGGMEAKLVPRDKVDGYHTLRSGPIHGVSLLRRLVSAAQILVGIAQAWNLTRRLRPGALFLTGGWVTFPAAVGCWLRGVPIAIYLPDIEPGLVVKTLSRIARLVMAPVEESRAFFPKGANVVRVGYPLRDEMLRATRAQGIAHFGLDPARQTLLVWGGSRGAQTLNNALAAALPDLLAAGLQILHVSGELDWPAVQARRDTLPPDQQARYKAFPYLHGDMGLAMAAADLAVSRAGASTLGEYPHFGLPAILVPLSFAWRYQQVNADWLAAHGAAVRLDNERLADELVPSIRAILSDPARLDAMRSAARALSGGDVAGVIADHVMALALAKNAQHR